MNYDFFEREEHLEHHGILGQKWGIRRFQPYSVRGRKNGKGGKEIGEAAKKKYSKRERKQKEKSMLRDVKNRSLLSDRELEYKLNRLKMERELKTITEEQLKPGKRAVKNILNEVGQDVAKASLKTAVRKMVGEDVSLSTIAEYLRPGGGKSVKKVFETAYKDSRDNSSISRPNNKNGNGEKRNQNNKNKNHRK